MNVAGPRLAAWLAVSLMAMASCRSWALNNCLEGDFLDQRGQAEIQIANDDPTNPFRYRPRCVMISEGTRVIFRAVPNFGMHPLYGGVVSGGQPTIDPESPIGSISSGNEAERLLGILDTQLEGRDFIAGSEYSIADMAAYPWISPYAKAPLDLAPFANVRRWHAAIHARPATKRAYALTRQVSPDAGKPLTDDEKKLLFGQGARRKGDGGS